MANPATDHAGMSVEQRLENADKLEALTEDHGGAHAEPLWLGIAPPMTVVAAAMAVFIAILLWKRVPGALAGGLDRQIAAIKAQLDEAKALRAEAEGLRNEYAAKIAGAEKDAAAMLDHARSEADAIVAKAHEDTTAMIARREKMAEDRIGAAERAAVLELRARAAEAAARAARTIIAERHDAGADRALVERAIAEI